MVSAAGLEPATHALKEYPASVAQLGKAWHEWRYHLREMELECEIVIAAPDAAHCCHVPLGSEIVPGSWGNLWSRDAAPSEVRYRKDQGVPGYHLPSLRRQHLRRKCKSVSIGTTLNARSVGR